MEQFYLALPKEVLLIIIALLVLLFVYLFNFTLKKIEVAFANINARLDIVCINQEATDYALDKCKLSNGKPYIEHRNERKNILMKELEYTNQNK